MADTGLFLYNEKFGRTQPRELILNFKITGAKTVVSLPLGVPVLTTFDAIAAQSTIDNFLGTTSEFNYLAYDATSMGTDAFGVIIDMKGQAARLDCFTADIFYTAVYFNATYRVGAWNNGITNTQLETACALGANGNIALKMDWHQGAVDALTGGLMQVKIYWSAIK